MTEKTQMEKKLFDLFSIRLMPADFYELDRYCVRSEVKATDTYSVWLSEGKNAFLSAANIENMINNSDYTTTDKLEFALPQGYKKMSVCAGSEAETIYFPYYLGVFLVNGHLIYEAYRIDNGAPIPHITEMYTSSYYRSVVDLIYSLCIREEKKAVNAPHLKKTVIMAEDGKANESEGFFRREHDNNYEWHLTDKQLGIILGVENPADFSKGACNIFANDDVLCLNNYDAGKLVFLKKTDRQRELLLNCISADADERKKLFEKYTEEAN